MRYNFFGKHVIVTGGRRGIGLAIAEMFDYYGGMVTAVAKSDDRGALSNRIKYVRVDLADVNALTWFASTVNRCDILVNCAAAAQSNCFDVNYLAPVILSRAMVRKGASRIINITSVSSFKPARNIAAYAASKAALTQWTKCTAIDWGSMGVTVNCVAPGLVVTDMFQPEDPEALLKRIPTGRFTDAEEAAEACCWLADMPGITGQTIVVDGGWGLR